MKDRVTRIARFIFQTRTWLILVFQTILIVCSLVFAWLLRFDFALLNRTLLLSVIPFLIANRLIAIRIFGLHRGWWRYVGVSDITDVMRAIFLGSLGFFVTVRFGLQLVAFPRSIYVLEALLSAGLLMGIRIVSRAFAESAREEWIHSKRVLIIGAGFAAQMILREIRSSSDYVAVGCVDDDVTKHGLKILGVPVLGGVDDITELVRKHNASEVLIAVPSATSVQMQRFVESCEQADIRFKTVPALRDFLLDEAPLSQVREVNLDDLLGREPVNADFGAVIREIEGKVILVTGAAGSIGSEICRQVCGFRPARLICFDQDETSMFYLRRDLIAAFPHIETVFRIGDVTDSAALLRCLQDNKVGIIFHAAAYKHVPMMEVNVREAVRNNVFGFLSVLDAASRAQCQTLVLISSDKAVNPTNVMGATKRICELILAARPDELTRCVAVRFGNVLGSNGSLIPILQDQMARGLPLTITDPEIRRFFMTINEAVTLVLHGLVIGGPRDVLVLDMGKSLKILDIAKTLIRLSGKSANDVPIVFTGLREGEKFCEELFYREERLAVTSYKKIYRIECRPLDWVSLRRRLDVLEDAVRLEDTELIRDCMVGIVPEYVCSGERAKGFSVTMTA